MTPLMLMISAFIFCVWFLALSMLVPKVQGTRYGRAGRYDLTALFGYQKLKAEAESAGWNLNMKEFISLVGVSLAVGIIIAAIIKNVFFIGVGIALSFMLPRYVIMRVKRRKRMQILFDLPDNMKVLISKLNDFPSLERAFEVSLPDFVGDCGDHFQNAYKALKVKLPPAQVFDELNRNVRVNKLKDFTEKLIMASKEGFHLKSIESLKETQRSISFDIRLIKGLDLKAKAIYRKLYAVIIMSWAMPLMLSGMNTNNGNVFLNSLHGQVFIVVFFIVTIFCIVKADDYLSLKLDDI